MRVSFILEYTNKTINIKTAKSKYFCQFYIIQKKELPLLKTSK
jgi:hypothetical protein